MPDLKPSEPVALMRLIVSTVIGYLITQRIAPRMIIDQLSTEDWIEKHVDLVVCGLTLPEPQSPGE